MADTFLDMSLARNKRRQYRYILKVYREIKQEDIPDTYIVERVFPKYHIYISYRQWSRIKGTPPVRYVETQLSIF